MGMFDTVEFNCPHCGKALSIQSKAGPRELREFTLDNAPVEVLQDICSESKLCKRCGALLRFGIVNKPVGYVEYKY
jgi:transcription elongation factor Elf1